MSERGDKYAVRIARIDDDAGNVAGVVEPEVCPRFTGVGRTVYPVAVGPILPHVRFTAADVDDVRIGRRYTDRADRGDLRDAVADVPPARPTVCRLPHAAVDGTEVEHVPLRRIAGNRNGASAAEWSHQSPSQPAQISTRWPSAIEDGNVGCARAALRD